MGLSGPIKVLLKAHRVQSIACWLVAKRGLSEPDVGAREHRRQKGGGCRAKPVVCLKVICMLVRAGAGWSGQECLKVLDGSLGCQWLTVAGKGLFCVSNRA